MRPDCRSFLAVAALLVAGCGGHPAPSPAAAPRPSSPAVDVDAAIARRGKDHRLLRLLFVAADTRVRFDAGDALVVVDLRSSNNRPVAARFHVTDADTPASVVLSPAGLIMARDDRSVVPPTVTANEGVLLGRAGAADDEYAGLKKAVADDPSDGQQLRLADFLRRQQNDYEALPHYAAVAHDAAVDVPTRVRAWVDLVRCHQWVGEPEKGRHEAQALLAALGGQSPDARAGGNLVLGFQDATAKRYERARAEFTAAYLAAPDSGYAKEAIVARAKLPTTQR